MVHNGNCRLRSAIAEGPVGLQNLVQPPWRSCSEPHLKGSETSS